MDNPEIQTTLSTRDKTKTNNKIYLKKNRKLKRSATRIHLERVSSSCFLSDTRRVHLVKSGKSLVSDRGNNKSKFVIMTVECLKQCLPHKGIQGFNVTVLSNKSMAIYVKLLIVIKMQFRFELIMM